MATHGIGNLKFIETTIDKIKNIQILKNDLLQHAENMSIRSNFRFYQVNDPKHKSGIVKSWISPQLSDLNITEWLGSILKSN